MLSNRYANSTIIPPAHVDMCKHQNNQINVNKSLLQTTPCRMSKFHQTRTSFPQLYSPLAVAQSGPPSWATSISQCLIFPFSNKKEAGAEGMHKLSSQLPHYALHNRDVCRAQQYILLARASLNLQLNRYCGLRTKESAL